MVPGRPRLSAGELGTLFALRNTGIVWSISLPLVMIVLYLALGIALFWLWSIELAMAWPMLSYYGVMVVRSISLWYKEARDRQQIKGVFARMLSPEVMNHLLENPGALEMGGQKRAGHHSFLRYSRLHQDQREH